MADQTQFHLRKKPQHVDIGGTGGTAAAPAIAPVTDTDSGLFFEAGAVGFAVDGAEVARIDSGGIVPAAASVTAAKLATALAGSADGLGILRVARATFDPSAVAGDRTVAAHDLGVTIPDNAIIVGGFVDVITTFASAGDLATIALSVEAANDIVTAIAINDGSNPWDADIRAITPKANTPETTGVKTSAARAVTATVAVEALTAGKAVIFLYYVQSA